MRLLRRIIRLYSILSITVLAVGIPVFYFSLQVVVNHEVDEELVSGKARLIKRLQNLDSLQDASKLDFIDHEIEIKPHPEHAPLAPDRFEGYGYYDSSINEAALFRTLSSTIQAHGKYYDIILTESIVNRYDLVELVILVQIILLVLLFLGLWMINKNVASLYVMQKEFTENAAHEMQTPLAVFQSKIDLLMQTSPINESQAELISQMDDASRRMNRLNKGLVMLTRIQNDQFSDQEKIDWGILAKKLLEEYEDIIAQKQISARVNEEYPLVTYSNKTLIEILIGNLLSNAIRHNVQGGFIHIILNEKEFVIENSGKAKPLNAVTLFQRFKRDSSDENSLGIGLEIIDKICEQNHYSIRYAYDNNKHTFIVRV